MTSRLQLRPWSLWFVIENAKSHACGFAVTNSVVVFPGKGMCSLCGKLERGTGIMHSFSIRVRFLNFSGAAFGNDTLMYVGGSSNSISEVVSLNILSLEF